MIKKNLEEDLRNRINDFLKMNYGLIIPSDVKYIMDEGVEYIYVNDDPNIFIYIPKKAIRQI